MTVRRSLASQAIGRRDLLRVGGVGALGLSLPDLMLADEANAARPSGMGPSGRRPAEKSCIFIYQYGGLSQLDSWDPKPGAPQEV
ncbi:MAG: DUF1501 domain-containing protein, partial [Planctomycetales bacterium]|nr:DUF1501 domain-containing protein [Planctomycetales bacterium]